MKQKNPIDKTAINQPSLISQQSFYQGQLPPPEMMANKMLVRTSYMGMIFAFLSVLIISGLVFYAFYLGFATQAAAIATGVIVGIAGVFLLRRKISK